jgi:hypothetical protein
VKPLIQTVPTGCLNITLVDFLTDGVAEYQIHTQEEFEQKFPQLKPKWLVKVNGIIMRPEMVFTIPSHYDITIDPEEPF